MIFDLPEGWKLLTISELAGLGGVVADGDWIESKDQDPDGDVRLIQLADIGEGEFLNRSQRFLTSLKARELQCTMLQPGDLLIARMPDPLGRACLFPGVGQPSVTAVDIFIWRPGKGAADTRWLMLAVNSPEVREHLQNIAGGTTRQRVSGGNLKRLALPTPPKEIQLGIVSRLETLLGCSKTAREELDHIPKLIERYRAAILSAAFAGRLTEDWREDKKLPAPKLVDLSELCASITDGDHQAPPKAADGLPFITIGAMNSGRLDLKKATRFVPRTYWDSLKPTRRPEIGDVLYSVTGSIGIPALVDTDQEFVFQRHIAILKPDRRITDGRFIAYLLDSPQCREQAAAVATGTAQMTIPLSGLRSFEVPLPTPAEQNEIVSRINDRFAHLDGIVAEVGRASGFVDRLEGSVLSKAFRGKLIAWNEIDGSDALAAE